LSEDVVVDGCEERGEEARWRGKMSGCLQRNDAVPFAPSHISDFSPVHSAACEMTRER
ncbi:hypothetical protein KUCAC02_000612, partial [Chaenocephalus aceratus]